LKIETEREIFTYWAESFHAQEGNMLRMRFPTIHFAAILMFALLVSVAVACAQDEPSEADSVATKSVIQDQLEAFRSHDLPRAYSHAAPNIRTIFPSVERFSTMVENGYGPIYSPQAYVFGRSRQQADEIHQEVIITDENGKQWQAVYSLMRQDDDTWQITGVILNPYKGASA
jgi:hypothetical protein